MFWVNVPVCAVGLVLAARFMAADTPSFGQNEARPRLDVPGLVLITPAVAAVILGLTNAGRSAVPAAGAVGARQDLTMSIRVPFYFVDVFASQPLAGNPLPLVPDADALDQAQMHAVAREFNQSETTFLLRPSLPGATVRLRSFTPAGAEVGGAGHNALGAWVWLEATALIRPAPEPSPTPGSSTPR